MGGSTPKSSEDLQSFNLLMDKGFNCYMYIVIRFACVYLLLLLLFRVIELNRFWSNKLLGYLEFINRDNFCFSSNLSFARQFLLGDIFQKIFSRYSLCGDLVGYHQIVMSTPCFSVCVCV